jgi:hypothetical protein
LAPSKILGACVSNEHPSLSHKGLNNIKRLYKIGPRCEEHVFEIYALSKTSLSEIGMLEKNVLRAEKRRERTKKSFKATRKSLFVENKLLRRQDVLLRGLESG